MKIDGFKLFRNDRFRRIGGGVALYVRDSIKVSKIVSCSKNTVIEFLILELLISNTKYLVGVIYNPNVGNDLTELEEKLSELVCLYDDVIVTGDFNIDLLSTRPEIVSKAIYFKSMINSLSLDVLPSNATHFVGNCSSLLDLFIVKSKCRNKVLRNYQISVSGISRHDLIGLAYSCPVPNDSHNIFYYRDFSSINYSLLRDECLSL